MSLTPNYLETYKKIGKSIKSGMPVTALGMYDCGKGFLFGNLTPKLIDTTNKIVKIDLSGTLGDERKTLETVNLSLSISPPEAKSKKLFRLGAQISASFKKGKNYFCV